MENSPRLLRRSRRVRTMLPLRQLHQSSTGRGLEEHRHARPLLSDVSNHVGEVMADSTLDLSDVTPPVVRKGHGTSALGPSDSSDSGSDLQGPGIYEADADVLGLDTGTNEDAAHGQGAGRDVGDANLDSDSDAGGTGERASAGRDLDVEAGSDI